MAAAIDCLGLTKRFGRTEAVSNLSLSIEEGRICALLGPNGAGKSTTLNLLAGLIEPNDGTAMIWGQWPPRREDLGVVPDELALYGMLTVEEHLELTGSVHGLRPSDIAARTDDLLAVLDFEHGRHTYAEDCSHGMRKKTALSMALLPAPSVLLLDEPFEGLDPVTARTLTGVFRRLASSGRTILLSSHSLELVERTADEVIVIDDGEIVHQEPVSSDANLSETYFDLIAAGDERELQWLG